MLLPHCQIKVLKNRRDETPLKNVSVIEKSERDTVGGIPDFLKKTSQHNNLLLLNLTSVKITV
jgi:hypothetical protein